jgi:hypothetical protein
VVVARNSIISEESPTAQEILRSGRKTGKPQIEDPMGFDDSCIRFTDKNQALSLAIA